MKTIKITFGLLLISLSVLAQMETPVKWSFTSLKKADNVYEVVLSASVSKPWHIYSQFTPKGGPLPTDISFATNPILIFEGAVKESGELVTNYDKSFKADVKYFSNKVDFVQTVKTRGTVQTGVRGTIEYMVCDDTKCLPPVKQPFEVKLQ